MQKAVLKRPPTGSSIGCYCHEPLMGQMVFEAALLGSVMKIVNGLAVRL